MADDAGLLAEVQSILSAIEDRRTYHRLDYYEPYEFQKRFHNARGYKTDKPADARMLMAANQIGKTICGAYETAIHLTGLYPDDWDGTVFEHPIECLCGSNTNETTRDLMQKELFGLPQDDKQLGTGAVPRSCIGDRTRKPGVPNAFDTVMVKHHDRDGNVDGWSKVAFRAYEQGAKKHMGLRIHFGWMDEEPPADIWAQYLRGTFSTQGRLIITMTPEEGVTDVVHQFMTDLQIGQALIQATWDDAPHMTEEVREAKLAQVPKHEREMRSRGIPKMGTGLVFPVPDEDIMVEPFAIPHFWRRGIGLDFGWEHPAAAAWLALDPETNTTYVYNVYRKDRQLISTIASAIKSTPDGSWAPVAWPHDGMEKDRQSGKPIAQLYREQGLNMLINHFSNPPAPGQKEGQGGQGVEVGLTAMLEAMEEGRFKVFSTCPEFFDEKGTYHRVNGVLVKKRDDVMSATRYAFQSKRHFDTRDEELGMKEITITGVGLFSVNEHDLEVRVEVDGVWRRAIVEKVARVGGAISHICEPRGIANGSYVLPGPSRVEHCDGGG